MVESQDKRQEILKAANECFARYGYEKTTLDDIGKIVGLNKASLYYYYKNKEAIFSEVIIRETDALFGILKEQVDKAAGCKAKILLFVTERLKYFREMTNLQNLSVETYQSFKPVLENIYQTYTEREIDFLSGILENCRKQNEITAAEYRRIAESILTITDAVKQKYAQRSGGCFASNIDHDAITEEVQFTVSLILDGILTH